MNKKQKKKAVKKPVKKKKVVRKKAKKTAIQASQSLRNGRNKRGQFAKGNKTAKGHKDPKAEMRMDFKRWFKEAITKEDIQAIAKALVRVAKRANIRAAKEIMDRCMGKAEQAHEVSGTVNFALAMHEAMTDDNNG